MNIRKTLEWLGGSVVVYGVVAACGSSSGAPDKRADASHAGRAGSSRGGMPNAGGEDGVGGLGGILDPVPDAGAADAGGPTMCDCPEPPDPYVPPEPLVVEAACDVQVGNMASGNLYAVIDRPDLPEIKLLQAIPVFVYAADQTGRPTGHRVFAGAGVSLSATDVAVNCGIYGAGATEPPETVRFIFPR